MIDLHTHSFFSDGTDSPEELVARGVTCSLRALALTDHDTVAGLERFRMAAAGTGVEPINGVELSAGTGEISLHLLGYGFDPDHKELTMFLKRVQTGRAMRNEQILHHLNRLGYEVSEEEVRAHAGDELVGRPHFAAVLMQKGYFRHPRPVFEQLLGRGRAAYVDRERPAPEECVALIRRAGGAAVLAHPGQTGLSVRKLRRLLRRFKEAGLAGLEVWHPSHHPHQTRAFQRMCDDLDLVATGGSDAHGNRTPDIAVGFGRGDLHVPDETLEALCQTVSDGGMLRRET